MNNLKINHAMDLSTLVEKYYPADFTEQERLRLSSELEIIHIERSKNPKLRKVSTTGELCKVLVESKKRESYYLLDRLIRLILTLSVSTATADRGFSAMEICKSRLHNMMSDDFLADSLVVYTKKKLLKILTRNH
uniref:Zinc finger MYM-type protein 1-like n=1 Tax=Tanacetum cinerariifolium TaxID=118510 RepID=A0A6L2K481_TANCI|nr:zinc finger MYM-type protein 1-like [Tanacetum cinerariifolium]